MEGTNDKTSLYLLVKSGRYIKYFCHTAVFCHISIVTNHFRLVSYHFLLDFCQNDVVVIHILIDANHFYTESYHLLPDFVHFRFVANHF